MKSSNINKNKEKKNTLKVIGIILILIVLILTGYLTITDFGIEKINLTYFVSAIIISTLIIFCIILRWALAASFRLNKETRNIR